MAIIITDECINCDACITECPNNAIYEPKQTWAYSEGTDLKGEIIDLNGDAVSADEFNTPISDEVFYIVPDKCTECIGFHPEPQCALACPVDCCIHDVDNVETQEKLTAKKE